MSIKSEIRIIQKKNIPVKNHNFNDDDISDWVSTGSTQGNFFKHSKTQNAVRTKNDNINPVAQPSYTGDELNLKQMLPYEFDAISGVSFQYSRPIRVDYKITGISNTGTTEYTMEIGGLSGETRTENGDYYDIFYIGDCWDTTVNAGEDDTIFSGNTYQLNASATEYLYLLWTTNGSGTFSDDSILNPIYTPSNNDINNSGVTLTLTATNNCYEEFTDSMYLEVLECPIIEINAGSNSTVTGDTYTTNASGNLEWSQITWTSNGSGYFDNEHDLSTVYHLSQSDKDNIEIILTIHAQNECSNISDSLTISYLYLPPIPFEEEGVENRIFVGGRYEVNDHQYISSVIRGAPNAYCGPYNKDGSDEKANTINPYPFDPPKGSTGDKDLLEVEGLGEFYWINDVVLDTNMNYGNDYRNSTKVIVDGNGEWSGGFETNPFNVYTPPQNTYKIHLTTGGTYDYLGIRDLTRQEIINMHFNAYCESSKWIIPTHKHFPNDDDGNWNIRIQKIKLQSDGKFVVCGYFGGYDGHVSKDVIRFNSDGSVDTTFIGEEFSDEPYFMDIDKDGKILISGRFYTYGGVVVGSYCRLNSDGSLDIGSSGGVESGPIKSLDNGKFLVFYDGHFYRLNNDFTSDNTWADYLELYEATSPLDVWADIQIERIPYSYFTQLGNIVGDSRIIYIFQPGDDDYVSGHTSGIMYVNPSNDILHQYHYETGVTFMGSTGETIGSGKINTENYLNIFTGSTSPDLDNYYGFNYITDNGNGWFEGEESVFHYTETERYYQHGHFRNFPEYVSKLYIPSKDEIELIHNQSSVLGYPFPYGRYISSTEIDIDNYYEYYYSSGNLGWYSRNKTQMRDPIFIRYFSFPFE